VLVAVAMKAAGTGAAAHSEIPSVIVTRDDQTGAAAASRVRMWTSGRICWTSEKQRGSQSARGEPQAGGGNRVDGRRGRIDHLDEVQTDLRGVAQVTRTRSAPASKVTSTWVFVLSGLARCR